MVTTLMDVMKRVYIAGPYRAKTAWDIENNIRRAERVGMMVAEMRYAPVIPHPMYRYFHGTLSDQFWIDATESLLASCHASLFLFGWEESSGSRSEYAFCREHGVPYAELQVGNMGVQDALREIL